MHKLSKRQNDILTFIKTEVSVKGYPPSVREIGEAVGLASSSTVHGHLDRLENKGYIRRDRTKPRALEVIDQDITRDVPRTPTVHAPVIGKVTAGQPITAIENVEEFMPLPEKFAADQQVFVLNVEGDSMIQAGIHHGDQVIVRQQQNADNGDIVVAMTDESEATVKRFFKESDHIRLQPENDSMAPLLFNNVTILGKVVGIFRLIH